MVTVDLYHGTSSYFARKLLSGGARSPLYEAGALECATELLKAIIAITGSEFRTNGLIYSRESGAVGRAPLSLRAAADRRQDTLMDYGDFYASLSPTNAAYYAANSPYGSELLWAIKVTIDALRFRGYAVGDELAGRFPLIEQITTDRHAPVVIALTSVPIDRLRNESGSTFTDADLARYQELSKVAREPGSVRVSGRIDPFVTGGFSLFLRESSLRTGEYVPGTIQDEDILLQNLSLCEFKTYCGGGAADKT